MGKREGLKIILRIAAAALAVACIWAVTDKLFSAANETERILERIEILPAGSVAENKDGQSLPAAVRNFEITLREDYGTEIVKHYDIRGRDAYQNIYGYMQVWKTEQSLEHYLKISREYMSANVFGFREETVRVNGVSWQRWDYIVNDIAVSQGFTEKEGQITLCSLCVPYQERTAAFDKIFLELLESVVA
ncbi:MAG: hypothetical protein KHX22_02255 [Clostridiales bacterium]|jgi:hypothetical protein|nr:hypothetical protein [Clostridiales bacterium]PWM22897.1 MAG: hypothetical protein DBX53_02955 [Clostridiales bacterium]